LVKPSSFLSGCLKRQPLLFLNKHLPQTPKGDMLILSHFPSGNKRVKLADDVKKAFSGSLFLFSETWVNKN
jgi:hypothetical protein